MKTHCFLLYDLDRAACSTRFLSGCNDYSGDAPHLQGLPQTEAGETRQASPFCRFHLQRDESRPGIDGPGRPSVFRTPFHTPAGRRFPDLSNRIVQKEGIRSHPAERLCIFPQPRCGHGSHPERHHRPGAGPLIRACCSDLQYQRKFSYLQLSGYDFR